MWYIDLGFAKEANFGDVLGVVQHGVMWSLMVRDMFSGSGLIQENVIRFAV